MQRNTTRMARRLMGSTILVGVAAILGSAPAFAQDALETVTVTGYRASLESAANIKRTSVGFSDAVFAEDIGKFPDTNLAEALNRIPGITLTRDTNGEGVNISIRGLGTNFTKITLNNAQIAIATTGATDSRNNNREVDLNMFPSELFTQLQVDKTPRADLLEGGAGGNVNMRTQRAFDHPGLHVNYSLQGIDNSISNGAGGNGALVASDTWDSTKIGSFGALIGVAARSTYNFTSGWEAGNSVYITPNVTSAALCYGAGYTGAAATGVSCDMDKSTVTNGNGSVSFNSTLPFAINGYAAGTPVDAQVFMALNPGVGTFTPLVAPTLPVGNPGYAAQLATFNAQAAANAAIMTKVGNAMIPRLARDMYQRGTRDRYNMVANLEWRPTDNMHFYLDMIGGRQVNDIDRSDMDWAVRFSTFLPTGMTLDKNGVLTGGRFYNSQFFLEARRYKEKGDFFSVNPGLSWDATDLLHIDLQANASRSHFIRDAQLELVQTPADATKYVDYTATGVHPTEPTNINLNDPNAFLWNGGRAWIQDEKRYTQTSGIHLDVKYGGEEIAVKVGASWDDIARGIGGIDASTDWAKYTCGGGATGTGTCDGQAGSAITNANLHNFLVPGPTGFVRANYPAIEAATRYNEFLKTAQNTTSARCDKLTDAYFTTTTNTGGTSGCYDEKVIGLYAQLDGKLQVGERALNYDVGLRWVETHQSVQSPAVGTTAIASPYTYGGAISGRNFTPYSFPSAKYTYQAFLPSLSLVYHVADDFLIRGSVSRTMNRADVSQMISVINFSSPEAQSATLGNPGLKPYFANNIDLGMEYYSGGEGYFSVAAFRKGISGFFSKTSVTQPLSYMNQFGVTWTGLTDTQRGNIMLRTGCTDEASCASAPVVVTQPINAQGMETINGLELGYVQPLDFLLEQYGVKGIGLSSNATIVDQTSSGVVATHALGVAPYTYNVTGYYENDGVMLRLSYVFTALTRVNDVPSLGSALCLPNTQSAVDGCPQGPNQYAAAYGQTDFSSSLRLSKILGEIPTDPELTFSIQNVFNAKQVSYFQYTNTNWSYYRKGQTYMFGVHGSL